MVTGVLELLGGGFPGEGDFEDGEEAFFPDCQESLLTGFPNINNFSLVDTDDLMKAFDLATQDFSNPEGLVHETLGCLDGDEVFAFTKEESESA